MLMYAVIVMVAPLDGPGGERAYEDVVKIEAGPSPAVGRPEIYAKPVTPPFEPPSRFGRRRAQGDGEADLHRRPLSGPVAIDAYRHSYEYSPSDSEIDYDQGVAQARIDAQARLGPLDGVWRVRDADGDTLSDLVVGDAGGQIVAAWNIGRVADRSVAATARRDGQTVTIENGLGARTARLRLSPTVNGWVGELSRGGREQPVTLTRSNDL